MKKSDIKTGAVYRRANGSTFKVLSIVGSVVKVREGSQAPVTRNLSNITREAVDVVVMAAGVLNLATMKPGGRAVQLATAGKSLQSRKCRT